MKTAFASILVFAVAAAAPVLADSASEKDVAGILQDFVDDYGLDPADTVAATFGVRVGDVGEWHIVAGDRTAKGARRSVRLVAGASPEPTFVYVTDAATLGKIHRGEQNALTAMGKASSRDFAPMDVDVMKGFQPDGDFVAKLLPLTFHFWTRGVPEKVPFGDKALTRQLHGANVVIFYYQPGFRSGWFQIEKGQHVNEDPEEQTNPFPSMFVLTRGEARGRIGGKEITIRQGESLVIPAGITHEFWNTESQPAEGLILMFGEGA